MQSDDTTRNVEDVAILTPPAEPLSLALSSALREQLLEAMAAGGSLAFDASGVVQVDTASLQILCAAARDIRRRGDRFTIRAPSAAFTRTVDRLGLGAVLGLASGTEG